VSDGRPKLPVMKAANEITADDLNEWPEAPVPEQGDQTAGQTVQPFPSRHSQHPTDSPNGGTETAKGTTPAAPLEVTPNAVVAQRARRTCPDESVAGGESRG